MSRDIPETGHSTAASPAGTGSASVTTTVTATVWPWREAADGGDAGGASGPSAGGSAEAAARARRGAALRSLVGLGIAALLLLWKPWLAAVVTVISLLVLALALASPLNLYARFEHGLDRVAHGVGLAMTWILMPILYVLLFLPVGLLLRAAGKLRLTRRPDPGAATYWLSPQGGAPAPADGEESPGRWQGSGLDRYRRQF